MAVSDWQTKADDNTDVDGVDISRGFPARNVGSAFRNIMADTKAEFDKKQAEFEEELNKRSFCGEIRLFFGTLDADGHPIPLDWAAQGITTGLSNWHVCDGTSGTPDMRGRVAVGVSDSTTLGQALGSDTVTPTITIGATAQQTSLSATTLSVKQLASHAHEQGTWTWVTSKNFNSGNYDISNRSGGNTDTYNNSRGIQQVWSYNTGYSWAHNHGVSNPYHTHVAYCASISMMPPAKAVQYVMRLS